MKIGTPVCLVGTDGFMPPIGSCGVIVSEIDDMGDYDVDFPDYLCPVPPDPSWVAHHTWLVPLDGYQEPIEQKEAGQCPTP